MSYLHHSVLGQGARLLACNYYSTTVEDAAVLGMPTGEYTDYTNTTLTLTRGVAMRPELVRHFVNGKISALDSIVRDIAAGSRPILACGREGDKTGC